MNGFNESVSPKVEDSEERYRPAYELLDGSLERAGRVSKAKQANGMVP